MKHFLFIAALLISSCIDLSTDGKFFKGMSDPAPTPSKDAGTTVCECQLPPPACDGNKRIQAISARCLDNGGCAFRTTETECPNGCSNAACNGDACLGVTCNKPPPAVCSSPQMLQIFSSQGTCAQGVCQYASAQVSCTCSNGSCEMNKCAGQTCSTPPPDQCLPDARQLRTYSPVGVCDQNSGACFYSENILDCGEAGCSNSFCNANMCLGVSCTNPPAANCINPTTQRTYAREGVCHIENGKGVCTYTGVDNPCGTGGCVNGACQEDKCINVVCQTPPGPSCASPSSVLGWSASGTCDPQTGNCAYKQQIIQCPKGQTCNNGQCAASTCNSSNCKGCCDGNQCIGFVMQSRMQCGREGNACQSCGPNRRCQLGECKSGN